MPGGLTAVQEREPGRLADCGLRLAADPGARPRARARPPRGRCLPGSRYRDRESGREFDGVLLREYGLPLELPSGDYASALTILDRIPDSAP